MNGLRIFHTDRPTGRGMVGYGWTWAWLGMAVLNFALGNSDAAVFGSLVMAGILGARSDIINEIHAAGGDQ